MLEVDIILFSRIGQETLMEENLADDDIEIELAPIAVQLAYIQQVRWQYYIHAFLVSLNSSAVVQSAF